jgi:hypothetical protein
MNWRQPRLPPIHNPSFISTALRQNPRHLKYQKKIILQQPADLYLSAMCGGGVIGKNCEIVNRDF